MFLTGLLQSLKSQGITKFFQRQGKVSEFCTWSGKFGALPKGKDREKSGREIYISLNIISVSLFMHINAHIHEYIPALGGCEHLGILDCQVDIFQ